METSKIFKIMLADDDADDRDLFSEAISEHQVDVDSVPNGVQLMKILNTKTELPDFVFIDLNMPEKSGKECLQEIRNQDRFKDLPIIIYSTSSSKRDIDDTFELGANLYITKPNSFSALKRMVTSILSIDWNKFQPGGHKESFVFKAL
ncbi:MAG TPA: response regulator [Flavobacterium sp.]|nr:response regulator [Flavobacterium sp.]